MDQFDWQRTLRTVDLYDRPIIPAIITDSTYTSTKRFFGKYITFCLVCDAVFMMYMTFFDMRSFFVFQFPRQPRMTIGNTRHVTATTYHARENHAIHTVGTIPSPSYYRRFNFNKKGICQKLSCIIHAHRIMLCLIIYAISKPCIIADMENHA